MVLVYLSQDTHKREDHRPPLHYLLDFEDLGDFRGPNPSIEVRPFLVLVVVKGHFVRNVVRHTPVAGNGLDGLKVVHIEQDGGYVWGLRDKGCDSHDRVPVVVGFTDFNPAFANLHKNLYLCRILDYINIL